MATKEVHNAIVTRNTDPDSGIAGELLRGGVFFNAPTLFEGEYPLPAEPCFPFASVKGAGMFWVPQVDDEIEVEILVDDGTSDTSDVELPEPRWRCMVYSDPADIAPEFKKNYGNRMGWKSNSGHILFFDDTKGEERIEINTGGGGVDSTDETPGISVSGHSIILDDKKGEEQILIRHSAGSIIQIDKSGSLKLIAKDGAYLFMNADKGETSLVSKDGALIKLAKEIVLADSSGKHVFSLDGKTLQFIGGDEMLLNAGTLNLEAGSVNIGKNAFFKAVLAETLKVIFDAHFHPSAVGLTGPPAPPNNFLTADATPVTAVTASFIKLKGNLV